MFRNWNWEGYSCSRVKTIPSCPLQNTTLIPFRAKWAAQALRSDVEIISSLFRTKILLRFPIHKSICLISNKCIGEKYTKSYTFNTIKQRWLLINIHNLQWVPWFLKSSLFSHEPNKITHLRMTSGHWNPCISHLYHNIHQFKLLLEFFFCFCYMTRIPLFIWRQTITIIRNNAVNGDPHSMIRNRQRQIFHTWTGRSVFVQW